MSITVTRHNQQTYCGVSKTIKQNTSLIKEVKSGWFPYYELRHIELNLQILSVTQFATQKKVCVTKNLASYDTIRYDIRYMILYDIQYDI